MNPGAEVVDVLTPAEIAELFRCHIDSVYDLIHSGQLPAVRIGRSFRLRRQDAEAFLAGEAL